MKKIVIVGRPNVGKSTLFNALIGKRIAITHESPGVTRDTLRYNCDRNGTWYSLMDSAGLLGEGMYSEELSQRSYEKIPEADCILFTVSVEEISAEDRHILERLRKVAGKVILVVNKVDNETRLWNAHEFYSFGFKDVLPVSAVHRKNIAELWELIERRLNPERKDGLGEGQNNSEYTAETEAKAESVGVKKAIRLLVVGKPNSGKSSFFNYMLKSPRNLVSPVPGTTRDSTEEMLHVGDKEYCIVDTAGLRKKNKIYDSVEWFASQRSISNINTADIVLLFVDSMEELGEQDKKIATVILSRQKSMIICLNKWDLIQGTGNRKKELIEKLRFRAPQLRFVPVCTISSVRGFGIQKLFHTIDIINVQLHTKIATSHLNRILQQSIKNNPPPIVRRRRGKLRFAAQASSNPMRFELHVNDSSLFSASYAQYLSNYLRREYRLSSIPIFLELTGA